MYIWLQVKIRGPDQPPKPTGDPDPRSRPIQTSRSRPMIHTLCFILFGFVDPDPLFYFGVGELYITQPPHELEAGLLIRLAGPSSTWRVFKKAFQIPA